MARRTTPPRRPLECVLVATDFSPAAARAVERAARLPIRRSGRLHLVHVLPAGMPAKLRAAAEVAARPRLERAVAEAREVAGALPARAVTSEILCGSAHVEIIRRSRAIGADLIVLGYRGRRRLRSILLGTTAARVVRMGDVPVLVVRRPAARPYRRALLATDLEDTSFRLAEVAQRVLGPGGATVELVHAYHVPFAGFVPPSTDGQPTAYHRHCRDKATADLAAFARTLTRGAWRWKPVVRQGDARLVILDEVARRRPDVLVLGTHGRTGTAHALLGSVAESAIGAAPCDVLVARPARFSFQLP